MNTNKTKRSFLKIGMLALVAGSLSCSSWADHHKDQPNMKCPQITQIYTDMNLADGNNSTTENTEERSRNQNEDRFFNHERNEKHENLKLEFSFVS